MTKKDLKIILISASLLLVQGVLYFFAKLTPRIPTFMDAVVDDIIPYVPQFVYFYILWYLLLVFVPYLLYKRDEEKFYIFISVTLFCFFIDLMIFVFFPTTMIRADLSGTGISNWIVKIIYMFDTPALNCLPSQHCVLSFLFIILTTYSSKIKISEKILVDIFSLLIVLSTLFIKQHVIYDVLAGLIVVCYGVIFVVKTKVYLYTKKQVQKLL